MESEGTPIQRIEVQGSRRGHIQRFEPWVGATSRTSSEAHAPQVNVVPELQDATDQPNSRRPRSRIFSII